MARRTYRRKRYNRRRRYYRRKKAIYATNSYHKIRIVKLIRLRVNDYNNLGQGYQFFDFGQNNPINANNPNEFNIWTDMLVNEPDYTTFSQKYSQMKVIGISFLSVPSNTQMNAINNRIDCTSYVRLQPMRAPNGASNRVILMDPLSSNKMFWKTGSWCPWCPSNPTMTQTDVANGQLLKFICSGNSFVNTQANCPQWSIRLCFYILFKGKQSD